MTRPSDWNDDAEIHIRKITFPRDRSLYVKHAYKIYRYKFVTQTAPLVSYTAPTNLSGPKINLTVPSFFPKPVVSPLFSTTSLAASLLSPPELGTCTARDRAGCSCSLRWIFKRISKSCLKGIDVAAAVTNACCCECCVWTACSGCALPAPVAEDGARGEL